MGKGRARRRDREGLLAALIERARELGYHKLVLAAFLQNEAGMRLYTRFGFREVGVYREQGLLDGRWVDVIIMERMLDESGDSQMARTRIDR